MSITSSDSIFYKALEIAIKAHYGQVDKGLHPYILHPVRVSSNCQTIESRTIALLHDVIEDTDYRAEELISEGIPKHIVEKVEVLTRKKGETYNEYIDRIAQDNLAREVKIADLKDNLDLSRIASPTDEDHKRCEKYRKVLEKLTKVGKNERK